MADVDLLVRGTPATATNNTPTLSATSDAATAVGDYLLVIADVDFTAASGLTINTSTGVGAWTLLATSDDASTLVTKAWLGQVTTAGARTVTVAQTGTSGPHLHVYTLNPSGGTVTLDGSSTIIARNSPAVHTAISPAGTKSLLVCAHGQVQFTGTSAYGAAPAGMTAVANYYPGNTAAGLQSCRQTLAAAGSTGTRSQTFTPTALSGGAGLMVALRSQTTATTKSGSDTGTGTQTGSVSATTTATTDTATGGETGYVAVPRSGSDTGTGGETLGPLNTTTTGGDTATGDPGTASIAGTTTGADTGTGAELAHIDADTLAAPDAGAGTEHGHIVLPGGDTAAGAEQLVDLHAWVTSGDTATGADGGYVESLLGDLVVSIFAITDTGIVPLPDYQQLTLAPTRNGPGSITLTYPVAGLNFDTLRDNTVGDDRDLEVEIWTIGSPLGALRGYLQEGSGDDVKEGAGGSWQFTGGFLELRMAEAIIYPQPLVGETTLGEVVEVTEASVTGAQWSRLYALGYRTSESEPDMVRVPQKVIDAVRADQVDIPVLADPKREAKFEAATPGAIMAFLLGQSWARGALDDVTTSFTADLDTNGTPWPSLLSTQFSPGTGYDAVLGLLVTLGLAEWSVSWTGDRPCLNMWIAGDRGVDRSVGARPVVLRAGRNLAEAPRKWSVRASPTAMLGIGAEGFYADTSDLDVETRRGRRIEASTSSQNLAADDAVLAYAQRRLETSSDGTLEVTVGLALLADEPRPAVAFDIGDWAQAAFGTGLDAYRIVEWSLTIDAARQMSATVTLNDTFTDELVRQRQQLDAITSGAAVVGTSEPPEDRGVPAAPTGVVVGSAAFLQGSETFASVLVGWPAVQVNTDGSAATDIEGYLVAWTLASRPDDWTLAADVVGTQATFTIGPALPIRVRVQARDRNGNRSDWSAYVEHLTEDDLTPPPVPSTPACSNFLGTLRIAWDGLTDTGADMQAAAADFDYVEVHVDPGSAFTPTTGTLVGRLSGHGEWVVTDLPYDVTQFVRLVAVDNRSNRSAPSAQGSATPGKVVSDDVFAGAIGTAQLANLAVKNAQIDNLAVNDAKIGDVSMGKVTAGSIAASMIFTSGGQIGTRPPGATGSGWTGDSAGIRFYDSAGNQTIQLVGATGAGLFTGDIQTGRTGRRITASGADNAIRFYPASTTLSAALSSFIPTNFPGTIALQMASTADPSIGNFGLVQTVPDGVSLAVAQPASASAAFSRIYVGQDTIELALEEPTTHANRAGVVFWETSDGQRRMSTRLEPNSGFPYFGYLWMGNNGQSHIGTADVVGGVASFRAGVTTSAGSGLVFVRNDSETRVVNAAGDSWRSITASGFVNGTSTAAVKDGFEPLPDPALQVLRNAPITRWNRVTDPPGTPPGVGPITEDLPDWALHPPPAEPADGEPTPGLPNTPGLNLNLLIGLVWDAVRELDAELDEVRAGLGRPHPRRRTAQDLIADVQSGKLPRPQRNE